MFNYQSISIFIIGLGVIFCGCKPQPNDNSVAVSGKLTNNGQPLVIQSQESGEGFLELKFHAVLANGTLDGNFHQVRVQNDGSFNVLGPSNRGLPPGKYRISVHQFDPYPNDRLGGKFDETNSTITREINGPTVLNLDLAKPNAEGGA